MSSVRVMPAEERSRRDVAVSQSRNPGVPPPESARARTLRRSGPGSWARASRAAWMRPAAVSGPALPALTTMASGSPFPRPP